MSNNTMPVIDMHAHTSDEYINVSERFVKIAPYYGIRRICLLGDVIKFGFYPTESQIRIINDETIRVVKKHPDILRVFVS